MRRNKKKIEEEEKKNKREQAKKEMKKLEELAMMDSLSNESDERRNLSELGDENDAEISSEQTPSSESG